MQAYRCHGMFLKHPNINIYAYGISSPALWSFVLKLYPFLGTCIETQVCGYHLDEQQNNDFLVLV